MRHLNVCLPETQQLSRQTLWACKLGSTENNSQSCSQLKHSWCSAAMKWSHSLPYHSRNPGYINSLYLALKALVMFLSLESYFSANLKSHFFPTKWTGGYPTSSGKTVDGKENIERTRAFFMVFRNNECNFLPLRTFLSKVLEERQMNLNQTGALPESLE